MATADPTTNSDPAPTARPEGAPGSSSPPPTPTVPPVSPTAAAAWMNQQHFVAMENGQPVVFTEAYDYTFDRWTLHRSTFEGISKFYKNRCVVFENARFAPLGDFWLRSPRRRQYAAVVFDPSERAPENCYNLWRGFSVDPDTPGVWSWSLLKDHLQHVICRGDGPLFNYLMGWFATLVQHPEQQAETALAWRGPQGAGKSVIVREIGKLLGSHFLTLQHPSQISGRFNAHFETAILVLLDEAFGTNDKQAQSVLKTLITEKDFAIERKHQNLGHTKNRLHLILCSNEGWMVPVGLDDRRFCVVDVSGKRCGDHAYFGAIVEQMNHGGREAMLTELVNYDLSTFNIRKRPLTNALLDQKKHSMSPDQVWWFEKLQDARTFPHMPTWITDVPRDALVKDFGDSQNLKGTTPRGTATKLGMFLPTVLPTNFPKASRHTVSKVRSWIIPSLRECRDHFAGTVLRQDIPWPEAED